MDNRKTPIGGIDHVAFAVSDIEKFCDFYDRLVGIERRSQWEESGRVLIRQIAIGETQLSLHQIGNGIDLAARRPSVGGLDICLRWNGPIQGAVALLEQHGIAIEDGPSPRTANDGRPATSVYFRDLDENLIEFMAIDPR